MRRSTLILAGVLTGAMGLAALAIATRQGSGAATRPGAQTPDALIIDFATEFLSTACQAAPGTQFAKAWLAYEDRHRRFFDAMYYASEESRNERAALAERLGPRRDEMCGHVRAFLVAAPGTIESLRARVADLLGHFPGAPVYFAVALQWTDGRTDTFDGRNILVLNARHDTFARTTDLVATIAHELIHDAQSVPARGEVQGLPPVARSLYQEGGAVFGVQVLLPELGAGALNSRPEQIERAEVIAPVAAGEILGVLRAPEPGRQLQRFFFGGQTDVLLPPRIGYYLGSKIYQDLARRQGDAAASRIAPSAFLSAAESYLSDLSHQPIRVLPPPAELSAIERLRDGFMAKARRAGFVLPFIPGVREWTRPSIASWTSWQREARAVAVPRWEELNQAQRTLVSRMAGGEAGARRLFDALFRWFLVPHELTRALQDSTAGARPDRAAGERQANDVAVAFLKEAPETRRQLFALAPVLLQAKERLPSPAGLEDEEALNRYFNDHYDDVSRDHSQYLAFRLHFILDSFRRLDGIRFEEAMQRAMGSGR